MEGEIIAAIVANFAPPASMSKKKRNALITGFVDVEHPTKKPDCDNIAKVVLDALNGVAYKDDSQVVTLNVTKIYNEHDSIKVRLISIGGKNNDEAVDEKNTGGIETRA